MVAWITSADISSWLGPEVTDPAGLAQAATAVVQTYLGRDLALSTAATDVYDTNGTDYILLARWPVVSIGSVSLNNLPVRAAAPGLPGWMVDPVVPRKLVFASMGRQGRAWRNVVLTNVVTGYDVTQPVGSARGLPGDVAMALRLAAAALYNAQAADPNLAAESTAGAFSGQFYASGVGALPPGAISLLKDYRRVAP